MRKRLTKPVCNSKPPKGGSERLEIWDTDLPGFGIRIWRSRGRKDLKDPAERVFFVMYRDGSGKLRRYTIGSFHKLSLKAAKEAARAEFAKIANGSYPHARKRREKRKQSDKPSPGTWGHLIEQFIASGEGAKGKLREKTAHEYARLLRKHYLPVWEGLGLDDVETADVIDIVQAKRDEGKDFEANRILSAISSLCSWARNPEHPYLNSNPCEGLKQKKEKARDRVLNVDEIRVLWKACEAEGYPYGPCLQMMLIFGQRNWAETGGMRWSALDMDKGIWRLKASDTKTDQEHLVPLPNLAVKILKSLPVIEGEDRVFGKVESSSKVANRIRAQMEEHLGKNVDPWQPRDFRRTVRTNLAALGVLEEIGERILSHSRGDSGIAAVYNRHSYLPQMREALELWANRIQKITSGKKSKVERLKAG